MLHVVRSELTRMAQRRTLLTWFGLMALFAVMVNTVMSSFISSTVTASLPSPGVTFPTRAELESPTGIVAGLAAASNLFGVVTLSFWAMLTAQDFSSGLIRLLVAAEPRRWRLLAGKIVALLGVTAIATTVATVADVLVAGPTVSMAGISTSAWGTDLASVLWNGWFHLYLSLAVWGLLGLVIAVLARSSAVAISIGIGYVLVVESLVKMAGGAPSDWLLGTTLNAIAGGGTAAVSFTTALGLAGGYVIVGLVLAGVVVTRRDVTD